MKLEIDLNKTIEVNAGNYYEKVKKLKKKLLGANEALIISNSKLEKTKKEKGKALEKIKLTEKKEVKLEWYEKFRWFVSSEGFLVIGGRDATSNEIVIKKHTEKNDLIFHTDIIGSPFFVIQTNGKKPGEDTIRQAADATVTFSRAFKLGVMSTKTFMARPDQLTKEAKPGEYVPKGGFITKGGLKYIENKVNLAIGNYSGKIMAGPLEAVKKHCKDFVKIEQGREKPGKVAKLIQKKIGGDLDTIIRNLPAGTFKVVK